MRCFFGCFFLLFCSVSGHAQYNSRFLAWSGDDERKSIGSFAVLNTDPTWSRYGRSVVVYRASITSENEQSAVFQKQASAKPHTARLTWKPSSSHVAGYNVYRREAPGQEYRKINSSLVKGLSYADNTVLSGVTYYYMTRAVDDQGHESADSNETTVVVP
jgi:hypothetical protein